MFLTCGGEPQKSQTDTRRTCGLHRERFSPAGNWTSYLPVHHITSSTYFLFFQIIFTTRYSPNNMTKFRIQISNFSVFSFMPDSVFSPPVITGLRQECRQDRRVLEGNRLDKYSPSTFPSSAHWRVAVCTKRHERPECFNIAPPSDLRTICSRVLLRSGKKVGKKDFPLTHKSARVTFLYNTEKGFCSQAKMVTRRPVLTAGVLFFG